MPNHQHLVAIYADRIHADRALTALSERGFQKDELSVLAKDREDEELIRMYSATATPTRSTSAIIDNEEIKARHDVSDKDPVAMKKGAATGTIFGTALGLGALLIPGLGPVLAGGAIATAVATTSAWAAAGTTVGMVLGLINDIHIPDDRNEVYKAAFEKGKFLIIVHPEQDPVSRLSEARAALEAYPPEVLDAY